MVVPLSGAKNLRSWKTDYGKELGPHTLKWKHWMEKPKPDEV